MPKEVVAVIKHLNHQQRNSCSMFTRTASCILIGIYFKILKAAFPETFRNVSFTVFHLYKLFPNKLFLSKNGNSESLTHNWEKKPGTDVFLSHSWGKRLVMSLSLATGGKNLALTFFHSHNWVQKPGTDVFLSYNYKNESGTDIFVSHN